MSCSVYVDGVSVGETLSCAGGEATIWQAVTWLSKLSPSSSQGSGICRAYPDLIPRSPPLGFTDQALQNLLCPGLFQASGFAVPSVWAYNVTVFALNTH